MGKIKTMESTKKSNMPYAVVIGIAGGFATSGALAIAIAIYNDTNAAVMASAVAIFCSLLAVFLSSNDDSKRKSCTKTKTLNA